MKRKGKSMYCPNCGTQIPDEAKFCPTCGGPIGAGPASEDWQPVDQSVYPDANAAGQMPGFYSAPSVSSAYQPVAPNVAGAAVAPGAASAAGAAAYGGPNVNPGDGGAKRKRNIVIAVAAAVAVALCAIVGAFFLVGGNSQSEDSFPIEFSVNAAGLDTSTGTKVPIKVSGTTEKGETVDKVVYVGNGASSPKFAAGTYTVSVYASPIASDGTIYDVSSAKTELTILSDGKAEKQPSLTISPIEASKVTAEQIEAAYQAAKDGGADSAEAAEKLKDAATARMDEAKKQEQAASDAAQTTTQQPATQGQTPTTSDSAANSVEAANEAKVQAAFDQGKQVFFGTVYVCSSDDEVASVTGTKNPNPNSKYSVSQTTVVMVFDATDSVRAVVEGRTSTRDATCMRLPSDMAGYAGQHIAAAAAESQLGWPQDTSVPLGAPIMRSGEVLYAD